MTQKPDNTAKNPDNPQEEHPLAGLKVVINILDGCVAMIGVGKGAVDPHLEPCAISPRDELPTILAVVPEVLARAAARWETQPRFPNAETPNTSPARTAGQRQNTTGRGRNQPSEAEAPRMF